MEAFEQLALIWAGVLVAVWAAKHTRLTPVLYYLAVGAILVNAGLLPETPHEFIRGFAEIGILLIMFAIGFEEQANNFIASMRRSWGIALFGAIAPFAAAYAVTWYFWQNFAVALMAGLAMTATAVSLTMVALKAEGLAASPPATRIMTSAVLDDIGSLALVAIMVPIAKGGDFPGAVDLLIMIGKVVVFFSIVTVLGNWVFPHDSKSWVARIPGLRYFNMRGILRFEKGEYAVLILLLLAMVTGLTAHAFGFHPAVGAYMAGLIIREEYFDYDDTRDLAAYRDVKRLVDNVAFSWIGPVFFVLLGAHLIFTWETFVAVIPQTVILTVALFVSQVASAALAARYTGGLAFAGSMLVGFGMLGRAELAFVVLDIAYVQNRILPEETFYALMFSCFWLNVAVPLTIRWWKPYYQKEVGFGTT